jgi:phosphatidylserine/phosphatidylglycerophosphate/cardiolipin synthase-like enzyme
MNSIPLLSALNTQDHKGIGEYKAGKHWKNKAVIAKCADIFKAYGKVLASSSAIGTIVFFALPSPLSPIIALVITTISTLIGIYLITKTIYDLECIHKTRKIHTNIKDAPKLGQWTENSVFITKDGLESMDIKMRLIKKAERSIEISGSYCGGEIFDKTLDEISKKLERNKILKVKILSNRALLTKKNHIKIKMLAKKYPENFFFLETTNKKIYLPSYRIIENHVKFFIVDGEACITGGTGIQDMLSREGTDRNVKFSRIEKILGKGARDMDVVIEGSLAKTMRQEFFKLLNKWQYMTPKSRQYGKLRNLLEEESTRYQGSIFHEKEKDRVVKAPSILLTGSYEHGSEHGCKLAYIKMIRSANKSLVIANMSFNQLDILEEIENAVKRGVKFTLITNSTQKNAPFGAKILGVVNKYYFPKFLKKGLKIYEYKQDSTLYHKKVMVIDKRFTTIGSFNISSHCADTEDEGITIIDSEKTAKETLKILEEDIKRSHLVSEGEFQTFFGSVKRFLLKTFILQVTGHVFQ